MLAVASQAAMEAAMGRAEGESREAAAGRRGRRARGIRSIRGVAPYICYAHTVVVDPFDPQEQLSRHVS